MLAEIILSILSAIAEFNRIATSEKVAMIEAGLIITILLMLCIRYGLNIDWGLFVCGEVVMVSGVYVMFHLAPLNQAIFNPIYYAYYIGWIVFACVFGWTATKLGILH